MGLEAPPSHGTRPSTYPIAAATAVALGCHWQDASYSSPLLHAAHTRGTEVPAFTLCSLLTPCLTLEAHSKQIILGQAGIQGHHSFCCYLSSLQGCREAGDSGKAADHHTEHQEPCSRHSLDPAALAKSPWSTLVVVTIWRGVWGNLAYSTGQIKSFVTKLS